MDDDDAPPRILSVWGWCVDTIQYLSDGHPLHKETEQPTNIDIQRMFLVWHDSILKCLTKAKPNQRIAHENIAEALARTLLVDNFYTGKNMVIGAAASITDPVGCHARVLADLGRSKDSSAPATHISYDWTKDSTFAQQAFAACPGQRFAVAARGFFYLVPSISKMGDEIAIFSGTATPFIISILGPPLTVPDTVRINAELIGDAYMHELSEL